MSKRPGEEFDARISTVLRQLPDKQQKEIDHYRGDVYAGCEHLLNIEWDTPPVDVVDTASGLHPQTPADCHAQISSIVNELVWTDLQAADELGYPTPTARTVMAIAMDADKRASQIARELGCDKKILLQPTIGFIGLHNTILPPDSAARTRKADKTLETALDAWTRRFLRPVYGRYNQWLRLIGK